MQIIGGAGQVRTKVELPGEVYIQRHARFREEQPSH
jgi:hypothetical protein